MGAYCSCCPCNPSDDPEPDPDAPGGGFLVTTVSQNHRHAEPASDETAIELTNEGARHDTIPSIRMEQDDQDGQHQITR